MPLPPARFVLCRGFLAAFAHVDPRKKMHEAPWILWATCLEVGRTRAVYEAPVQRYLHERQSPPQREAAQVPQTHLLLSLHL